MKKVNDSDPCPKCGSTIGWFFGKYNQDDETISQQCVQCKYKEQRRPIDWQGPQPKPLKLEAGCRVNVYNKKKGVVTLSEATVLHSNGTQVMIINRRGDQDIEHFTTLTVTEAATPEVNDYVQVVGDRFSDMVGMLTCIAPDGRTNLFTIGGTQRAPQRFDDYFEREEFTILHKAPKEG